MRRGNPTLKGAVATWPTPRASEYAHGGPRQRGSKGDLMLTSAAHQALWPTPTARNPNDGETLASWTARRERLKARATNGNGMGTPLVIAVQQQQDQHQPRDARRVAQHQPRDAASALGQGGDTRRTARIPGARGHAGQRRAGDHGPDLESAVGCVPDGLSDGLAHAWPAGRGREQHPGEPPRLVARPPAGSAAALLAEADLEALGNSVVSLQAEPLAAAIARVERECAARTVTPWTP